jgi:hypothetical protein
MLVATPFLLTVQAHTGSAPEQIILEVWRLNIIEGKSNMMESSSN